MKYEASLLLQANRHAKESASGLASRVYAVAITMAKKFEGRLEVMRVRQNFAAPYLKYRYLYVQKLDLKDKKLRSKSYQGFSLLECLPKTGRTHQIRVHLASIGYPIAGDKLYGGHKNPLQGLARQFLHAESIEFTDSGGRRIKFEADLPFELSFLIK